MQARAEEPVRAGGVTVGELVQDRRSRKPHVAGAEPAVDDRARGWIRGHDRADDVGGEDVDGVPPRLGGDEHRGRGEERGVDGLYVAAQVVACRVLALALGPRPERACDRAEVGGRRSREARGGTALQLAARSGLDPVEREQVAHVRRHLRRRLGVGRWREELDGAPAELDCTLGDGTPPLRGWMSWVRGR